MNEQTTKGISFSFDELVNGGNMSSNKLDESLETINK
jgi:hypothetical protein